MFNIEILKNLTSYYVLIQNTRKCLNLWWRIYHCIENTKLGRHSKYIPSCSP